MIPIIQKSERTLILISLITFLLLEGNCSKIDSLETESSQLVEYTGFLKIPGVGFQTFYRFENRDPNLLQVPFSSGSAYFRWMWLELEPQEGKYNWDLIDSHLALARVNGQTLDFTFIM